MAKIQDIDIPYLEFAEAAAPGTPAAGIVRQYAKTDGLLYQKDDAGTETALGGGGGGGGELDYVEFTSAVNLTATTEATANTIVTGSAIAYDGATVVMIEFYAPTWQVQDTLDAVSTVYLYDGAASIGRIATALNPTGDSGGTGLIIPCHGFRRLTPSAATHTYSVRGATSTGTSIMHAGAGGNGAQMPGYIRIVEVG